MVTEVSVTVTVQVVTSTSMCNTWVLPWCRGGTSLRLSCGGGVGWGGRACRLP